MKQAPQAGIAPSRLARAQLHRAVCTADSQTSTTVVALNQASWVSLGPRCSCLDSRAACLRRNWQRPFRGPGNARRRGFLQERWQADLLSWSMPMTLSTRTSCCTVGRARKKTESLCSKTPTGARALRHMCQEAVQSLNHSTLDRISHSPCQRGGPNTCAQPKGGAGGP